MDHKFVTEVKNRLSVFPSRLVINLSFEVFLSLQNKKQGLLKQADVHDVHTRALFWVRRSVYGVLPGDPFC